MQQLPLPPNSQPSAVIHPELAAVPDAVLGLPWELVYHDAIDCLTAALEARDPYTEGHSRRVADMALQLAGAVGLVGGAAEAVHIAAHLHDIGKIAWPDGILQLPGPLSPAEIALIRAHPVVGHSILSRSRLLLPLAELVLYHHERWDGLGYPEGLAGNAIPLGARIIALCDSVDAMTSRRPYREPMSWAACRAEVERMAGSQFDPELVEAASGLWHLWQGAREYPRQ